MISIVIPALDEAATIATTIEGVHQALRATGSPYEILLVNDGSQDDTATHASSSGARVISHLYPLGYGRSLKDGIAAATHDTVVILDADATYPANRIPDLLHEFRKGYHMVIGARQGQHFDESWLKRPLRRLLRFLVEFTTGTVIPDVNSGMRVFSKSDITTFFPHLSDSFSFTTSSTLAYLMTKRYVRYVPIDYALRASKSKVRLFRDSLRTLQYITEAILYYNPIKLFLLFALAVFIPSVPLGLYGWLDNSFLATLTGCIGVFCSILIMGLGFLAESLRQLRASGARIQRSTQEAQAQKTTSNNRA